MQLFALVLIFSCIGAVESQSQCTNKNAVRLVGGTRNGEGRLEVLSTSGNWGSVCPDGWATRSAGIACQELCGTRIYASSLPAKGRFGPITNPIRIFDTKCFGYESSLLSCPHIDQVSRNCYEDTAVGLCCHSGCNGENLFLAPRLRYAATCGWTNYTVAVEFPAAGPDGVTRPFVIEPFNQPNCLSKRTGSNATHNWLTVPYEGDCGVSSTNNNDFWSHHQKVLLKGHATGAAISRFYQFLLPVTCGVNRVTNQTSWIGSTPNNGPIINLNGTNQTNSLDMFIKVYKQPDFTQQLATPVHPPLPLGTPLYIELSVDKDKLQGADIGAKIIVEDCFAFDYPLEVDLSKGRHPVINNQLAVDDATDIFQSPNLHKVWFKMQTFKLVEKNELRLSCAVYMCPSSDISPRCKGKPAQAQHKPDATRLANKAADPTARSTGSEMRVVTDGYEILKPTFKPKPIYDFEDLPGLDEDDLVRIGKGGEDEGKCFRVTSNGNIFLYRKPKNSSDPNPAKLCPKNEY